MPLPSQSSTQLQTLVPQMHALASVQHEQGFVQLHAPEPIDLALEELLWSGSGFRPKVSLTPLLYTISILSLTSTTSLNKASFSAACNSDKSSSPRKATVQKENYQHTKRNYFLHCNYFLNNSECSVETGIHLTCLQKCCAFIPFKPWSAQTFVYVTSERDTR